ncbi:MAG: hypothetical protein D6679_06165 [Candidatus Hydrogenedentota bacterium]|nr:MAG: hypothetical protein D6679_06165 [Candidatus Hydrogenedentota bacterium]
MENFKARLPQIAVVLTLLGNLGMAYPLQQVATTDPMAELPPPPPPKIRQVSLGFESGTDTEIRTNGRIPEALLKWEPFERPKEYEKAIVRQQRRGGEEERPEKGKEEAAGGGGEGEAERYPIVTDDFLLYGILKLDGRYLALISINGEPAVEITVGMNLPNTDVKVTAIKRDGIWLSQEGSLDTFLPLESPEVEGQPWYSGPDAGSIRGDIRIR